MRYRNSGATTVTIRGQDSDTAATFSTASGDLSNRPLTSASVGWSPPAWSTVGEADADQRTPDLRAVLQEIVDRPGWSTGGALALVITGSGERTAESYNGVSSAAPLLHAEYTSEPIPNRPPDATDDSATTQVDTSIVIDVASNDADPDGNLDPASVSVTCGGCRLPAHGSLADAGPGAYLYDPDPGYEGDDDFIYRICDTDGLCDTAMASISVTGISPLVLEVRVAAGSDDTEERASGSMSLVSSDLELVADPDRGDQVIGMRFAGLTIPQGAVVTSAWIQFQADERDSVATNLSIRGHDIDSSPTFTYSNGNVTSRSTTDAFVAWAPPAWTVVGRAGLAERTPELRDIVQEIIARPGWNSGNALSIIISGAGHRTAESYNGVAAAAPLIHIEYIAP